MCDCVGAKHGTSMAICPVVTPRSMGTRLWLRSLTSWRITSVHWYLHGIVCFRGVKYWKDLKGYSWEMVLVKAISGTKISLEVWSHSPFANPRSPKKHTHESSLLIIIHYSLQYPAYCQPQPTSTETQLKCKRHPVHIVWRPPELPKPWISDRFIVARHKAVTSIQSRTGWGKAEPKSGLQNGSRRVS